MSAVSKTSYIEMLHIAYAQITRHIAGAAWPAIARSGNQFVTKSCLTVHEVRRRFRPQTSINQVRLTRNSANYFVEALAG